jgi:hypothetical protein
MYTITGFVNSETKSDLKTQVSINRVSGDEVGTYAIPPSAAADANYTVSFVPKNFSITKAALTITANTGQTKVYGATDPTSFTYTITGLGNSDTEASLDTGVSISRALGEDVGTYAITPSAAADANYTVSFVVKDFSITKATQTITFGTVTHSDADVFDLTATSSSSLEVTFVSSDTSIATISGKTITVLKTGTINITASQVGNNNYSGATDVLQVLSILALEVEDNISLLNKIKVYPNPSSNYLKIDLQNINNASIRVFDITGKLILTEEKYFSNQSINISNLKAGVYFVRISKDKNHTLKKFVKN